MKKIEQSEFSYLFSKYEKPVYEAELGEKIQLYTQDAFSNKVLSKEDKPYYIKRKGPNPQAGPIYVKGISAGDTLKINIHSIEFARDYAASQISPYFGGLQGTKITAMLHEPFENETFIYRQDGEYFYCEDHPELRFKAEPFMGTIATAPALEALSALTPFNQGGNMDVREVKPGNIIYLPVAVDGAYFYTGDCHARQGDGELCGTALEIAANVVVSFEKADMKAKNPRIESDEYYMAVGSARPLEDAARIAWVELIDWLCEKGWDKMLAYQMLSQAGEMVLGNMVDTNYSMVAKVKKEYADIYLNK